MRRQRRTVVSSRLRLFLVLVAVVGLACGCGDGDSDLPLASGSQGTASGEAPPQTAAATTTVAAGDDGPIGGGAASGTGTDIGLDCPEDVEQDTEEWFGPTGLTRRGAVDEAFGDLVVGWIGEPFEMESTDEWSSWGLNDPTGNLVAVATVVATSDGWDPSHARYCVLPRPSPPPPPLTLSVSNQSFDDPTVSIAVSIDGEVVVDEEFDVEGQHNWIRFVPEVGPGDHVITAVTSTGAQVTSEFALREGEPRWIVLSYWFSPDEGPRTLELQMLDQPPGFG